MPATVAARPAPRQMSFRAEVQQLVNTRPGRTTQPGIDE